MAVHPRGKAVLNETLLNLKMHDCQTILNLDSTNKTLYFLYETFYNLIISKESINMEELALFFFWNFNVIEQELCSRWSNGNTTTWFLTMLLTPTGRPRHSCELFVPCLIKWPDILKLYVRVKRAAEDWPPPPSPPPVGLCLTSVSLKMICKCQPE